MMRLRALTAAAAALCLSAAPQGGAQQTRDLEIVPGSSGSPDPAASRFRIPRSYAVVIGISEYQHLPANEHLKYAHRDAEEMYSVLISREGGNFRPENVHRLVGQKATLANIRHELDTWLPSVAKEDDRVLVYYAGHGFADRRGYLTPFDFKRSAPDATGYSMEDFGRAMGALPSRWKVLLVDACHSGAIVPDAGAEELNRQIFGLSRSTFLLTASRDRERSFEHRDWGGGHGIFTYYVIRGLEGAADEDRDTIVTADELAEYVRRNVREATGARQNPTSERGSFDPRMPLAYVPGNVAPEPPKAKFGSLVLVSNMDEVEVFLNGKSVGIVARDTPLRLPGLPPGLHTIQGSRSGYEPDGPREEMVYPGQETTVTIRITTVRRRDRRSSGLLREGIVFYTRGGWENYLRAARLFRGALDQDPGDDRAALYLARAFRALYEMPQARRYFERAVEIDPNSLDGRVDLAGTLLDLGDTDEAIRQLNHVLRFQPDHVTACYLLAQAYRIKEHYPEAIEAAQRAVRAAASVAEPHFWLAEGLRMTGKLEEARSEYLSYLRLSDFDSGVTGNLNYYVLGFLIGRGKKKRAAQQDIWKDLRSLAYLGVCDCERLLSRFDTALEACRTALHYDPGDPYIHYVLGLCYVQDYNRSLEKGVLAAARKHFRTVLDINPEMIEAGRARHYLNSIQAALLRGTE
jgi:tetratricopeptide (TPR) repeat protein